MESIKNVNARRIRRKRGLRKRLSGTAERLRLSIFRSDRHIYAQIIDDEKGVTVCEASSRSRDLRDAIGYGGNKVAAKVVGTALAQRAAQKNIRCVCFDRNGFKYHGRIRALADAAREGGLQF